MSFIIIYITHESLEEAKRVCEHLLSNRIIACVNYFPIESMHWWKGNIKGGNEIVSIVKTRTSNWKKVSAEVKKMHNYDIPCIMKIEVEANEDYENWINTESK